MAEQIRQRVVITNPQVLQLEWQQLPLQNPLIYQNDSDMRDLLKHYKTVILGLINQFKNEFRTSVQIKTSQKDTLQKRLIKLENQIQSLIKRKIMFNTIPDRQGGQRKLDYTMLLNQKQNQIVQLQKKIQNIQQLLRRKQSREIQLQNQIVHLNQRLKLKKHDIERAEQQLSQQRALSRQMAFIIQHVKKSQYSHRILAELVIPSLDILDIRSTAERVANARNINHVTLDFIRKIQFQCVRPQFSIQMLVQNWIQYNLPSNSQLKIWLENGKIYQRLNAELVQKSQRMNLINNFYIQIISKIRKQKSLDTKLQSQLNQFQSQILAVLDKQKSNIFIFNNVLHIQRLIQKVVEVPVQDVRTKQLIHYLLDFYKKLFTKYPKLYNQMDSRLTQFFQQEMIDICQSDSIDRIIQVVKYVPQVVRVQNIYQYECGKHDNIIRYLRVLVRTLLQQLDKIKKQHNIVLCIDEQILQMIQVQMMHIINVQDILKIYKVNHKIVQVEKIVQKIVQKVVQIPKVIQVEVIKEKCVQVIKYEIVTNTIHVPLQIPVFETLIVQKFIEVPTIIEKIVQVPHYIQRIVQICKQVPKCVEVQKIVYQQVQVPKIQYVDREVICYVPQYRDVQIIKEVIVQCKQYEQKICPVDRIVQKVVQVRVQVPKIVQVQRIVQKIVQRVEYVQLNEIKNHVQVRYQPVQIIRQKIVPFIQTVQKVVECQVLVPMPIEVNKTVEKIKQIIVERQKIVYEQKLKVVQIKVQKPCFTIEYQTKQVQKIVKVPFYQQVIKCVDRFIQKPFIQRIQKVIHKEVQICKPKIIYQDRIKQVQKIINHVICKPQIVKEEKQVLVQVQKIVEIIRTVDKRIDNIIQVMVEVPKVVQVEKVVEKVVVVPRIIQKVITVPQIVDRIVPRVEIKTIIKQIQKRVQCAVIQQKQVKIIEPIYIYIQTQKPIRCVEQKLVVDQIKEQIIRFEKIYEEKAIQCIKQVPKCLQVQKIVYIEVNKPQIVQVSKQVVVPVQIQVPVQKVIQKIVPVQISNTQIQIQKVVQQVLVPQIHQIKQVCVVPQRHQVLRTEHVKEIVKDVSHVIQKQIVQIPVIQQKIVGIQYKVQQIKQVQVCVQKIVEYCHRIPQIIQKQTFIEKRVDIHKFKEVEKVVTRIVQIKQFIDRVVDKIIQIPCMYQQLKVIQVEKEKIVPLNVINTQVKTVDQVVEKQFITQRLVHANNQIHLIERCLKIVDTIVEKCVPVYHKQDKILEIPYIIQKIVQKITVMPQIVQVLKYVHQITQKQSLGVCVDIQTGSQQIDYKKACSRINIQLQAVLKELRIKCRNNGLNIDLSLFQKCLEQFRIFSLYPRIHRIIQQKPVEIKVEQKVPILIPVQSQNNFRLELSKSILIEKLIVQIKQLQRIHGFSIQQLRHLDGDINFIFFNDYNYPNQFDNAQFSRRLLQFTHHIQNKFKQIGGGWSAQHLKYLNLFIQQRFVMANIIKNQRSNHHRDKAILEFQKQQNFIMKRQNQQIKKHFDFINSLLPSLLEYAVFKSDEQLQKKINLSVRDISHILQGQFIRVQPMIKFSMEDIIVDPIVLNMLRQKQYQINYLIDRERHRISYLQMDRAKIYEQYFKLQRIHSQCRLRINKLAEQNSLLYSKLSLASSGRLSTQQSIGTFINQPNRLQASDLQDANSYKSVNNSVNTIVDDYEKEIRQKQAQNERLRIQINQVSRDLYQLRAIHALCNKQPFGYNSISQNRFDKDSQPRTSHKNNQNKSDFGDNLQIESKSKHSQSNDRDDKSSNMNETSINLDNRTYHQAYYGVQSPKQSSITSPINKNLQLSQSLQRLQDVASSLNTGYNIAANIAHRQNQANRFPYRISQTNFPLTAQTQKKSSNVQTNPQTVSQPNLNTLKGQNKGPQHYQRFYQDKNSK